LNVRPLGYEFNTWFWMDNAVARNQSHTLSTYRMVSTLSESLVSNLLAFFVPQQTPHDHNSAFRAQAVLTSVCQILAPWPATTTSFWAPLLGRFVPPDGPAAVRSSATPHSLIPCTARFRHFSTVLDMFDTLRHFSTARRANSLTGFIQARSAE
jgi:hypothetical protein